MSEESKLQDPMAAMQAMMQAMAAKAAAQPPTTLAPFQLFANHPPTLPATPMSAAGAAPLGVLIPIKMPSQAGEVTCYLQFGPEHAARPDALIMQLVQAGWPVESFGGGGFGGGGFGGGGFGGGGFGGGGFGGGGFGKWYRRPRY